MTYSRASRFKNTQAWRKFVIGIVSMGCFCLSPAITAQDGFRPLFDGESLSGWTQRGGEANYSVEEGVIVGTSVPRTPNSFLCTDRDYGNFVLEFEFQVDPLLNSGVQIRSQVFDEPTEIMVKGRSRTMRPNVVHGYQVEIDPSDRAWSAGIYDESRRGWLFNLQNNPAAREAFQQFEWNHYRIVCLGNHIQTWINGVPAANLTDDVTASGLIGLQVHGVGNDAQKIGKQVRWRNIRIKEYRDDRMGLYIGTYTGGESEGIYRCELDLGTGQLTDPELVAETTNPSFVALDPTASYLYAVSEVSDVDGQRTGAVSAFKIDPETGSLEFLNRQPSGGSGPCHLIVDSSARNVLVANYGGGSVSCLPIGENGNLLPPSSTIQHSGSSIDPNRQMAPHAHSINLCPNNRFAFVADLGLDQVLVYNFDPETGVLQPNENPFVETIPGGGPRHFTIHPSRRFAYVNNEMKSSVSLLRLDTSRGRLSLEQTISTLPDSFDQSNSTAEILAHPSGRFLYCSNRGHDSIAIFSVESESGQLTAVGHQSTGGSTPRNFAIDPSGRFLLAENQRSNTIQVFRIDLENGSLSEAGEPLAMGSPVCIRFQPLVR